MGTSSSVKRIILSTIFITVEFPFGLFHSGFCFLEEPLNMWDLSFPTRGGTLCPAVEARGLNHWTPGKPLFFILKQAAHPTSCSLATHVSPGLILPLADLAPALTACRDEDLHRVTEGPHTPFGDGSNPYGACGIVRLNRKLSKAAVLANFFQELFLGGQTGKERK